MHRCAEAPMAEEKNSPKLLGEDDFYELFFAGLENDK